MKQTVDWHSYWNANRLGFHEGRVNRYLESFLSLYDLNPGDTIFMPLCGKAVDILWLSQQGFKVIGIELSDIAVNAFFHESGLDYERESAGSLQRYYTDSITLFQGDYLQLQAQDLMDCKLVYDRAALVAIEAFNRQSYVNKMLDIIPRRTPILLVTLDYDQQVMSGPPYAVPVAEIEALFESTYQVEILHSAEQINERPRWRQLGLEHLLESALRLTAVS